MPVRENAALAVRKAVVVREEFPVVRAELADRHVEEAAALLRALADHVEIVRTKEDDAETVCKFIGVFAHAVDEDLLAPAPRHGDGDRLFALL